MSTGAKFTYMNYGPLNWHEIFLILQKLMIFCFFLVLIAVYFDICAYVAKKKK